MVAVTVAIFVFSVIGKASSQIEYVISQPIRVHLVWSLENPRWHIRIQGLKLRDTLELKDKFKDKSVSWVMGRIFHRHDGTIIYGEGYTLGEFSRLVEEHSKTSLWNAFFVPLAYADSCSAQKDPLQPLKREIDSQLIQVISKTIKSCDFSISEIIQDQINKAGKDITAIMDGSFFQNISSGLVAIREMLPRFYSALIVPMQELMQIVPSVAQALVCNSIKDKMGGMALAAITGGSGLPAALVRITKETATTLNKVQLLTNNRRVLYLAKKLDSEGKLDSAIVKRFVEMDDDFPSGIKRSLSGFADHRLMRMHIDKHGKELGFKSDDQYINAANKFTKSVSRENIAVRQPNGDYYKWNTRTNEVAIVKSDGTLRTYFKNFCNPPENQLLRMLSGESVDHKNSLCH